MPRSAYPARVGNGCGFDPPQRGLRMSYETLSALIGILGVIAGVVYGRLALRQAHAIAAAQGAYAAERLHLTLYGARLVDDYVVALPHVRSAPCVLPFNIGLLNAGER